MLGRARIERLVYPRGTPSHRFRILCRKVRYRPCDNSPGIPKVLDTHGRLAHGDLETTHRPTLSGSRLTTRGAGRPKTGEVTGAAADLTRDPRGGSIGLMRPTWEGRPIAGKRTAAAPCQIRPLCGCGTGRLPLAAVMKSASRCNCTRPARRVSRATATQRGSCFAGPATVDIIAASWLTPGDRASLSVIM
jgi:hypothetical protein